MMRYLGLCYNLRCDSPGEGKWQDMMAAAVEIPIEAMLVLLPLQELAERLGCCFQEYHRQDPTAKACLSMWGEIPCLFYQNAGFEYVWLFAGSTDPQPS